MKTFLAALVAFLLLVAGGFAYQCLGGVEPPSEETPVPDETSAHVELRIDESGSALDVTVMPLEVLQDSRCPVDVECIWAGTVQVRALLSSGLGEAEQEFELNTPITTEAEIVTLVEVFPAPESGRAILASDYRFTFEIAKR